MAALLLGYAGGRAIWPDPNRQLLQDLPILEDLDLYEQAGSIDFLHKLADTGLFGDDAGQVKTTPGLAVPESTADRQAEIARMTAAEKEHLVRKLERLGAYAVGRTTTTEAALRKPQPRQRRKATTRGADPLSRMARDVDLQCPRRAEQSVGRRADHAHSSAQARTSGTPPAGIERRCRPNKT